jgi:ABC-type nickel/cobalt efflux system permease component RcnA
VTTARLLVFVAIFFLAGSVFNAAVSHRPVDIVSLLLVIVSARWLIIGAARRDDALAKRLVRMFRME